jgi:hypothetical protein
VCPGHKLADRLRVARDRSVRVGPQSASMPDLRRLTNEELDEHLANVAGTTVSSLNGAYLELERRARARMVRAQEEMVASQDRVEASQARAEELTTQTARDTKTLVTLTWAIVALTIVNAVLVLVSIL